MAFFQQPSTPLHSPTLTSSYDFVDPPATTPSTGQISDNDVSSDDEIVWSASDEHRGSWMPDGDDDYVLVGSRRSLQLAASNRAPDTASTAATAHADIVPALAQLSLHANETPLASMHVDRGINAPCAKSSEFLHDSPESDGGPPPSSVGGDIWPRTANTAWKRRNRKKIQKAALASSQVSTPVSSYPSPSPSPTPMRPSSNSTFKIHTTTSVRPVKSGKMKLKEKQAKTDQKHLAGIALKATGLGHRPVVDDLSEYGEEKAASTSRYDEAVKYMTAFLSNPASESYTSKASRLSLLQALAIELGLCSLSPTTPSTSSLPASIHAAKILIKSQVFLNIRDYLVMREQGQAALQQAMHPTRHSLMVSLKNRQSRASLGWVKKTGLTVLLVSCYH